jgi:hypothetical protein
MTLAAYLGDEISPHPPYSPDLALSDFFVVSDSMMMMMMMMMIFLHWRTS